MASLLYPQLLGTCSLSRLTKSIPRLANRFASLSGAVFSASCVVPLFHFAGSGVCSSLPRALHLAVIHEHEAFLDSILQYTAGTEYLDLQNDLGQVGPRLEHFLSVSSSIFQWGN